MSDNRKSEQERNAKEEALDSAPPVTPQNQPGALLALSVLGVVYGDIGTSPIYALRECFSAGNGVDVSTGNVLGILSLIFWTLILVISLKYMVFVLRANNRGEGGTFALLALLRPDRDKDSSRRNALMLFGIIGASMLYAGAMITPAISVLSAVEGLQVAAPHLHNYVIPATIAILLALFFIQQWGTASVGMMFGPLTLVWFGAIAVLGMRGILQAPEVLLAVNPWYAFEFFATNGLQGYTVMFAVFLVATGGEALYADLGHFGARPIRKIWFAFVLPSLVLNYFGQGALLITDPAGVTNPFFYLAPSWGIYALIVLATIATCIASQAVITGAYSLTSQAVHLGLLPGLTVEQTSADARGQIYVPTVNWLLMIAAIGLVLAFRSSANLAAAYGIAVNLAMAITTVLTFNVAREYFGWHLPRALLFLAGFLLIDIGFLGANLLKIPDGGWLPLLVGVILFSIITTWRRGRILRAEQLANTATDIESFIGWATAEQVPRVPGVAVYLTGRPEETPLSLQTVTRNMGILHAQVILVTVVVEPIPKTDPNRRIELSRLDAGFSRIVLRYGFMQRPNIPSELAACAQLGLPLELDKVHYFIGHVDMLAGRKRHGMVLWRDRLFARMAANTQDATAFYQIPTAQTMKVGIQVGI